MVLRPRPMLSALLLAAGTGLLPPIAPIAAAQPAQPPQRSFSFSKEERAALLPVQTAITAKDWPAAIAALPAAQAAAQGPDALYALGRFKLEIGLGANDKRLQAEGLEGLIASGQVPAADLPLIYRNLGALASEAGDKNKAEAAFARVAELSPTDPEALVSLAKIRNDLRRPAEAVQLLDRAIEMKRAAGQTVDESWYKYALKLAFDGRLTPQAVRLSRALVAAYPSKTNMRDALLIYRDLGAAGDSGLELDLLRLARASGSLAGERDWYDLADSLNKAGLPGEAKAVLDEGTQKGMVDPKKAAFAELLRLAGARIPADLAGLAGFEAQARSAPTGAQALKVADAYFGYGHHAKAIALYREAIAKGSIDANVARTRLGMALAMAGDKAGAEAAFRAVTGPRADLAAFWLIWLAGRT